MEFILNLISNIKSTDLITFTALFLAYLAYRKSILDKYESIKVLVSSLKKELNAQSPWLRNCYSKDYERKGFFSPDGIVYKLSFESAKEIARRGISENELLKKDFENDIASFNERVDAFNAMLDYQREFITTNPVLSGLLYDKLMGFGLKDRRISLNEFRNLIDKLKNGSDEDKKIYFLAYELEKINKSIHSDLIGDGTDDYQLHTLWRSLNLASDDLLKNYKRRLPWYVYHKSVVIIIAITIFIIIENYL